MHLQLSTNFIKRVLTGLLLGLVFWSIYFYLPPVYFSIMLVSILSAIIIFELPRFCTAQISMLWRIILPFYPIAPFTLLIMINHNPHYRELLLVLFILVFSFDTGGYIIGSVLGKHAINPAISLKKTWEGVAGGYLFALAGMILLIFERGYPHFWRFVPPFTLIVCLLALLGDLFESWLKRLAGIKDSGTLLPGHGGFLDRFDGIMLTVFFFYLAKDLLIGFFIR